MVFRWWNSRYMGFINYPHHPRNPRHHGDWSSAKGDIAENCTAISLYMDNVKVIDIDVNNFFLPTKKKNNFFRPRTPMFGTKNFFQNFFFYPPIFPAKLVPPESLLFTFLFLHANHSYIVLVIYCTFHFILFRLCSWYLPSAKFIQSESLLFTFLFLYANHSHIVLVVYCTFHFILFASYYSYLWNANPYSQNRSFSCTAFIVPLLLV